MDTKSVIETWTGKGAHEAAERATREGPLFERAQEWGQGLVARCIKEDHARRGGGWVKVATWGVFLAPLAADEGAGEADAQGGGARHRKPRTRAS